MSKKKGQRSFKNVNYYKAQEDVTKRNRLKKLQRDLDRIAEALTRTSANAVAKRALHERKREGTAYQGREVEVKPEGKLPAGKSARAEVSVTMASPPVWRLPIDTTNQDHVQQAIALLVKAAA